MNAVGHAPRWVALHVVVAAAGLLLVGGALADLVGGDSRTIVHRIAPVFALAVLISLAWRYRSLRGKTSSETVFYVRMAAFFIGLIGMVGFALPFWPLPPVLGVALNLWAGTDPSRTRLKRSRR